MFLPFVLYCFVFCFPKCPILWSKVITIWFCILYVYLSKWVKFQFSQPEISRKNNVLVTGIITKFQLTSKVKIKNTQTKQKRYFVSPLKLIRENNVYVTYFLQNMVTTFSNLQKGFLLHRICTFHLKNQPLFLISKRGFSYTGFAQCTLKKSSFLNMAQILAPKYYYVWKKGDEALIVTSTFSAISILVNHKPNSKIEKVPFP